MGGGESWRGRARRSSALLPAPKQRHRAKPENGLGSDGAMAVKLGRNAIMGGVALAAAAATRPMTHCSGRGCGGSSKIFGEPQTDFCYGPALNGAPEQIRGANSRLCTCRNTHKEV